MKLRMRYAMLRRLGFPVFQATNQRKRWLGRGLGEKDLWRPWIVSIIGLGIGESEADHFTLFVLKLSRRFALAIQIACDFHARINDLPGLT
jgi:hypothetical protein